MAAVVIDIGTGREIHDTELSEGRAQEAKLCKSILEISALDGRTVFSIRRLLDKSEGGGIRESIAA